jgi:hypothetical protein
LRLALKGAFLAGFYDVTKNQYTLQFSGNRTVSYLKISLDVYIDEQLANFGVKTIGTAITRADLYGIAAGDMSTFMYLGIQRLVFQENNRLATINDPRASDFTIDYSLVRDAFGRSIMIQPLWMRLVTKQCSTMLCKALITVVPLTIRAPRSAQTTFKI